MDTLYHCSARSALRYVRRPNRAPSRSLIRLRRTALNVRRSVTPSLRPSVNSSLRRCVTLALAPFPPTPSAPRHPSLAARSADPTACRRPGGRRFREHRRSPGAFSNGRRRVWRLRFLAYRAVRYRVPTAIPTSDHRSDSRSIGAGLSADRYWILDCSPELCSKRCRQP